jgi:hypothetical protein
MFAESVASNEVMFPRMGKFVQELSVWQTGEVSTESGAQRNGQTNRCSLFHPNRLCTGTPSHLHAGAALLHPQGSHILRKHEPGSPRTQSEDPYVGSSSRYLPTQVDSCTVHYTDRIPRIDHM